MKPYPVENVITLSGLAEAYLAVKQAEAELTAHRREIARQIQELTGQYQEGQKTFHDGSYAVTIEQPVNRIMDWDQYANIAYKIPENLRPVRYKPELDITGVKYLQNNEPEYYAILATAMTTKPGAVRISIKKGNEMRKAKITLIATAIVDLDPANYLGEPTYDQMLQKEIECVEEDPACFLDCDVDHIHIEAELLPGLN